MISPQQDANKTKQPHKQQILSGQNKTRPLRIMGTICFGAICAYKRNEIPSPICCGICSQATSDSQLSRLITSGHYTSWNTDCENAVIRCSPDRIRSVQAITSTYAHTCLTISSRAASGGHPNGHSRMGVPRFVMVWSEDSRPADGRNTC